MNRQNRIRQAVGADSLYRHDGPVTVMHGTKWNNYPFAVSVKVVNRFNICVIMTIF